MAPAVGPSQDQERALRDIGYNPDELRETPREDITNILFGRMSKVRSQSERSLQAALATRKKAIREKGFAPGMIVEATINHGHGKTSQIVAPITEITETGYVALEGLHELQPPRRLERVKVPRT